MQGAMVLSILFKLLGAILEFGNQILVTRFGGVALFGSYSFYAAIAEITCWILFSGIVKTNAFYVSNGTDIRAFRKRFFTLYAIPVLMLASIVGFGFSFIVAISFFAAYLYAMQLNLSSFLLACRKYRFSVIGEYIVSRAIQMTIIIVLITLGCLSEWALVCAYAAGFAGSVTYFLFVRKNIAFEKKEEQPPIRQIVKKYSNYQLTDIANGMVNNVPIIIQFVFSGAFHAGVLSVILMTKKLISFVAGPTVKVYLPEFANRFSRGDLGGLRTIYREIVLLQMCFILPICSVLICVPDVILGVYNEELIPYSNYMIFASFIFLVMVLFGPQGNFLSMVGRESIEAKSKWASLVAMIAVMALTFGSDYFVLYGLLAQVVVDAVILLFYVCRTLGGFPLKARDWILLALPFSFVLLLFSFAIPTYVLSGIYKLAAVVLVAMMLSILYVILFFGPGFFSKLLKDLKRT